MSRGLREVLKKHFEVNEIIVDSSELDSAAGNMLSFFSLLIEADRRAGFPALNDTLHRGLNVDDPEYIFT